MRRSHPSALLVDFTGWERVPPELVAFTAEVRAAGRQVGVVADSPPEPGLPLLDRERLGAAKPTREYFAAACAALATAPEACLFVDERDWHIRGARAAGLSAFRWNGPDDLPYLRATLDLLPGGPIVTVRRVGATRREPSDVVNLGRRQVMPAHTFVGVPRHGLAVEWADTRPGDHGGLIGGRPMRVRGHTVATPCWTELSSVDPAAAAAFYSELFGWRAQATELGSTVFHSRDLVAAGVVGSDGQQSAWVTYFATDDIEAALEAIQVAGGATLRPPAQVGERGRAALAADAEGAVFGLWQRGTFAGVQVVSEPNAVCWHEVNTRDPAGAATFYGKVFGWTDQKGQLPSLYDYWEWWVHSRVVAGMVPMDARYPAEVPAYWRTTIEVDDCAAIAARGVELGGQVMIGPLDVGVGQYAQLLDPQGASFGVIELLPELRLAP